MAVFSSIQYTVGTALERAREGSLLVEVLVEGHWLEGLVAASDGIGVVLETSPDQHCVVRLERISAVRVGSEVPRLGLVHPDHQRHDAPPRRDSAMPMPGPRTAAV